MSAHAAPALGLVCRRWAFAAPVFLATWMALVTSPAGAQAPTNIEKFQIGLSTDRIEIGSDFSGARLVVFGALDDADARLLRQQRYDIVVALVGPRRPVIVREKQRTFGLWINRGSEDFEAAPASYSMTSTRPLADITSQTLRDSFSLGIENLQLNDVPGTSLAPRDSGPGSIRTPAAGAVSSAETNSTPPNRDVYATALRRIRENTGLYNETSSGVQFISRTLFRADLRLPADLPIGQHVVRAYLFKSGSYIRGSERPLSVVKTGFESFITDMAAENGVLYGCLAVVLAIFTGWFGRIMFKRD